MKQNLLSLILVLTGLGWSQAQIATTYYGTGAGTLGLGSCYFGYQAGKSSTGGSEGSESYNSFFGELCGQATTTGIANTAIGYQSLFSNTTHGQNTAIGFKCLHQNQANSNTGVGAFALDANTTGSSNTAVGTSSLTANNIGNGNSALGTSSLSSITGDENSAVGYLALRFNRASFNTAIGALASKENETGVGNTSAGHRSMAENFSGHYNSAFGTQALNDNETGWVNSAFGAFSGPTAINLTNTTALGYNAIPTASNQVRIGNSNVTSIGGKVMWSTFSDGRFKREVREDVSGLEFINKLRPVSYTVDQTAVDKFLRIPDNVAQQKASLRTLHVRETGFIAQEVETIIKKSGYVFDGVEVPQNDGDHYSIRYAAFVVPLVKAVQELTQEVESLKKQIGTPSTTTTDNTSGSILFQNTPNPFSLDTEISMSLPEAIAEASIIVYNLEGKQLKSLPIRSRGKAAVKIQGNELSAGMYIYALIADGKIIDTKRMILTGN
jgi:trimeric autotransporter adhesin